MTVCSSFFTHISISAYSENLKKCWILSLSHILRTRMKWVRHSVTDIPYFSEFKISPRLIDLLRHPKWTSIFGFHTLILAYYFLESLASGARWRCHILLSVPLLKAINCQLGPKLELLPDPSQINNQFVNLNTTWHKSGVNTKVRSLQQALGLDAALWNCCC